MNYIVLEGLSLYVFLVVIILILVISIGSIICAILSDKRLFVLENLLLTQNEKVRTLIKENFILRLKCGEFEIDEK